MNQKQLDKIGQYAAGAVAIAGLLALVYFDKLDSGVVLPIVVSILTGLSAFESGRRKGKKDASTFEDLIQAVANEVVSKVDEAGESRPGKSKVSETSESDPRTPSTTRTSGNSGVSERDKP